MALQSDLPERYRRADLRLRLFLFGDGSEKPGVIKGDESKQRISAELRHMRDAFAESIEHDDEPRVEHAEGRVAELEEELRRIAAARAQPQPRREPVPLLTAAEAAHALGVSASSVYRAVRRGDVRAVRPTGRSGRTMRIPKAEVDRLLALSPRSRSDPLRTRA